KFAQGGTSNLKVCLARQGGNWGRYAAQCVPKLCHAGERTGKCVAEPPLATERGRTARARRTTANHNRLPRRQSWPQQRYPIPLVSDPCSGRSPPASKPSNTQLERSTSALTTASMPYKRSLSGG